MPALLFRPIFAEHSSHALARRADPSSITGFLTSKFASLPTALTACIGVVLLLISLGLLAAGARSLLLGSRWGERREESSSELLQTNTKQEQSGPLAGGIGGLILGALTSGSTSAILVFLIVSRQDEPSLGSYAALVILCGSSLPGAVIGGRYRWVACICCALLGSFSLSLLFTLSFHLTTLLPRLVLWLVLVLVSLLLVLIPRTTHISLSVFSACAGAHLFIVSLDLFLHRGIIDAPNLLVAQSGITNVGKDAVRSVTDVVDWNDGAVKGLLAGWWLLAILGSTWQCWWWRGRDTDGADQAWNAYVATFLRDHPNRRGTYEPPKSFWHRLLHPNLSASGGGGGPRRFTEFPTLQRRRSPWDDDDEEEEAAKQTHELAGGGRKKSLPQRHACEPSDEWESDADTLLAVRRRTNDKAEAQSIVESSSTSSKPAVYAGIEFDSNSSYNDGLDEQRHDTDDDDDNDDDDDDEGADVVELDLHSAQSQLSKSSDPDRVSRPGPRPISALSGSTLVVSSSSGSMGRDSTPSWYSSTARPRIVTSGSSSGKVSRLKSLFSNHSGGAPSPSLPSTSAARYPPSPPPPPSPPNAVPATPSLLNALDRVRLAQRQARAGALSPVDNERTGESVTGPRSADPRRRASYDEWWRSVVEKADE